jgi:hypothetical protein
MEIGFYAHTENIKRVVLLSHLVKFMISFRIQCHCYLYNEMARAIQIHIHTRLEHSRSNSNKICQLHNFNFDLCDLEKFGQFNYNR